MGMLRWPDVIMKLSIVSPQVIRDFNVGISPTHGCTQVLFLGCTEWTSQISGQQPFLVVLACLLFVASAIPFNAAALPGGWHYNGDVARKPNLAIAEHVWPGLVKKELTFGGK